LSPLRRNSIVEKLKVKRLQIIQEEIYPLERARMDRKRTFTLSLFYDNWGRYSRVF